MTTPPSAHICVRALTNRDREIVKNTRSRVKIKSKLTNFKINSRTEEHNGK